MQHQLVKKENRVSAKVNIIRSSNCDINRNHTHTTQQKEMGESCDEGGPCPSHKIPQNTRIKVKYSEHNCIHLPINHITKRDSVSSLHYKFCVTVFPLLSVPLSNVDVSSL